MGIFSKLFVAVMAHIIMENADKKIKLHLICFQLKIMDILLSFFLLASLYETFLLKLKSTVNRENGSVFIFL